MARRKRREDRGLEEPGDYQAYGILGVGMKPISTWIAWIDWDKTLYMAAGFRTIDDAEAHAEDALRRSLYRRKG